MKYYIDTNIWLNAFKKEGDVTKGTPYWEIADIFVERVLCSENDLIICSGVILRELQLKLTEETYQQKQRWFQEEKKCVMIDVTNEDKAQARKWESRYQFNISFYDLIHLSVCKRNNFVLVTRDAELIRIAKENGVQANRPEGL